ncbi:hypothetical protein COCON_G00202500 [Conger conger]|uniref:Uncharacterized protein n=1 Tax=Conger conger TaxID=82655 RepID=A0A9Q1CZH5_CONCO|nr:hypothetical protein COCON_G00202500 [Conger conger]
MDYGALDSLVEYIATFVICWGKKKYRQQCAVDEQKGPLVDVDIDQPGDLPQKGRKKRALRRFFSRVGKALKSSFCCCCVPEGEE